MRYLDVIAEVSSASDERSPVTFGMLQQLAYRSYEERTTSNAALDWRGAKVKLASFISQRRLNGATNVEDFLRKIISFNALQRYERGSRDSLRNWYATLEAYADVVYSEPLMRIAA
ncbi:MAG TPA: hypothetical protein VJK51_04090 [Candidatus Nanoarchaeia archaeon]|nr:hypothetical protein [Candidatus Nanoarchaeia archaeon]